MNNSRTNTVRCLYISKSSLRVCGFFFRRRWTKISQKSKTTWLHPIWFALPALFNDLYSLPPPLPNKKRNKTRNQKSSPKTKTKQTHKMTTFVSFFQKLSRKFFHQRNFDIPKSINFTVPLMSKAQSLVYSNRWSVPTVEQRFRFRFFFHAFFRVSEHLHHLGLVKKNRWLASPLFSSASIWSCWYFRGGKNSHEKMTFFGGEP